LIPDGFYAETVDGERKVSDLYAEQLLRIDDVTGSVHASSRDVRGDDERAQARASRVEEIEQQMTRGLAEEDSSMRVEVVKLFSGDRYAAYTFRRYDDVRLVMAPEASLGFYGGDPDNFTYPRYTLDFSFFRVYDREGHPLVTEDYFSWSQKGAAEGETVFVVGNPGTTSRLGTVASLEYERDYFLPLRIAWLEKRAAALESYREDEAAGNMYWFVTNRLKASRVELAGLERGMQQAGRRADEARLKAAIVESDSLAEIYGDLFIDIEELQISKRSEIGRSWAFAYFGSRLGSRVLTRAFYAYYSEMLKLRGYASEEEIAEIRKEAMSFDSLPSEVEVALLALRLEDVREALGENDPS